MNQSKLFLGAEWPFVKVSGLKSESRQWKLILLLPKRHGGESHCWFRHRERQEKEKAVMQSFLKWNTVKFRGTCSISFKFFLQEWNRSCCRPCSSGCLQSLHRSLSFPPWPGSQAAQAHQGWRARAPGISAGSGGAVSQQSNNSSAGPGWRGRTGFCEHT